MYPTRGRGGVFVKTEFRLRMLAQPIARLGFDAAMKTSTRKPFNSPDSFVRNRGDRF